MLGSSQGYSSPYKGPYNASYGDFSPYARSSSHNYANYAGEEGESLQDRAYEFRMRRLEAEKQRSLLEDRMNFQQQLTMDVGGIEKQRLQRHMQFLQSRRETALRRYNQIMETVNQIKNECRAVAETSPAKHALEEAKNEFQRTVSQEYPNWMKQKERVQQQRVESINRAHENIVKQTQEYHEMKRIERELQKDLKDKRTQLEQLKNQFMSDTADTSSASLRSEIDKIRKALRETQEAISRQEYSNDTTSALHSLEVSFRETETALRNTTFATSSSNTPVYGDNRNDLGYEDNARESFPKISNVVRHSAGSREKSMVDPQSQQQQQQHNNDTADVPLQVKLTQQDGESLPRTSVWGTEVSYPLSSVSGHGTQMGSDVTHAAAPTGTRSSFSTRPPVPPTETSTEAHIGISPSVSPIPTPATSGQASQRANAAEDMARSVSPAKTDSQSSSSSVLDEPSGRFVPSYEWKRVPEGCSVPFKCQVRYNPEGVKYACIPSAWVISVKQPEGSPAKFAVTRQMNLKNFQRRLTGFLSGRNAAVSFYADGKLLIDSKGNVTPPLTGDSTVEEAALFDKELEVMDSGDSSGLAFQSGLSHWNSSPSLSIAKGVSESEHAGYSNTAVTPDARRARVSSTTGTSDSDAIFANRTTGTSKSSSFSTELAPAVNSSHTTIATHLHASSQDSFAVSTTVKTSNGDNGGANTSSVSEDSPITYSMSHIDDVFEVSNDDQSQTSNRSTREKYARSAAMSSSHSPQPKTSVSRSNEFPTSSSAASSSRSQHPSTTSMGDRDVITSPSKLFNSGEDKPSIHSDSEEESFPEEDDTGSSFEFGSGGIAGFPLGSFAKSPSAKSKSQRSSPQSRDRSAVLDISSATPQATSKNSSFRKSTTKNERADKEEATKPKTLPGFGAGLGLVDASSSSDSESEGSVPDYSPSGKQTQEARNKFDDADLEF
eukprot:gb/GECG01002691.1/.p1 GENE.gb/GECG01002691.1/~~gb/GECG01002691.1/.p1  ORF type:complete len:947 (+),score=165.07 gb/GECG01002691.1/:1-2841(+)